MTLSCESAKKLLEKDEKIEVKRCVDFGDSLLIDFKREFAEPYLILDCDDYCDHLYPEDESEYRKCIAECAENRDLNLQGSIMMDKKTGAIREATIPGDCEIFYFPWELSEEELKELEEKQKEFMERLQKEGCEIKEGWIHPHEMVPGAGEWEEAPAICYAHMKKTNNNCRIGRVLKIVNDFM